MATSTTIASPDVSLEGTSDRGVAGAPLPVTLPSPSPCDPASAAAAATEGLSTTEVVKEHSADGGNKSQLDIDPKPTFLTSVALDEGATPSVAGEASPPFDGAKANVQAEPACDAAPRLVDSRSLVTDTITTLDLPRLSFLHKEITKKGVGLDRIEFITTMATCVSGDVSNPINRVEDVNINMVANFCEIFAQMDLSNDGTVNWEELSSFMVEMGMRGWPKSGVGMPNYAYAGQVDSARPAHAADQIHYFPENDTVAVVEENANFFRVYDADSMHMKRQYDIKDTYGAARSLCYRNTSGHYVLGTAGSRVCFYEEGNRNPWKSFRAPSTAISMMYSESHDLVVAGDMIGNLFSWKIDEVVTANIDEGEVPSYQTLGPQFKTKRTPSGPEKDVALSTDGGHTDAVLGLLPLVGTDMIASCSMDRTVKLWELTTLGLRKTLLGHLKGVKHMAYCPDHRLIVSGGFSYDLVINNLYVSNPISRLRGHCSSIVGVEHVKGTSQLITADTDGFCKLWDLRTFSCVETFTSSVTEENRGKAKKNKNSSCAAPTRDPIITCMTVSPLSNRVLVGGQTVDSFEVLRDECEELTDDTAVLAVCFNATNLTFVTASAWAVKLWDGATGELLCSDARPSQSQAAVEGAGGKPELCSTCLGGQGRTIITGDGLGHIKIYNHINCTELKDFKYPECMGKAHEGSVRALTLVEEQNLLISTSADRSISIHDDSQRNSGTLLRRITNATWSEITAIRYSAHLGLIASGSTDGSIQLWDFENARHEGCCDEKHRASVTCLAFLDPFPILLSTDAAGWMVLWALPPARDGLRFKRIFTWVNKQPVTDRMYYNGRGGGGGETPVAVTALECQVEMISSSITSSSAACSTSISTEEGDDGSEESSLDMSSEHSEDRDDGEGNGTDMDKNLESTQGHNNELECSGSSHANSSEAAQATPHYQQRAEDSFAGPTGHTGADTNATSPGGVSAKVDPGGGGGGGNGVGGAETTLLQNGDPWEASIASPGPSAAGSSHDRSFQERLAATFRKYNGERRRHPKSTTWSRSAGREEQRRVMWNTDMLSYTVYAADEIGKVTTWDLKETIISLIHIYGGQEWSGHGVGVVQSPKVYSNALLSVRHDASSTLLKERYRLEAKSSLEWFPDPHSLGLHRIGSWEAHTEPVICVHLVDDPPTVLTSAMDRLVKLWSPIGRLRGVLRQKQDPDTPWAFRVNRRAQEDRKIRAAQEVILATKASYSNDHVAGITDNESLAQKSPPLLPEAGCSYQRDDIVTTTTTCNKRSPQQHKNNHDGSELSSRGGGGGFVEVDDVAGGHESIVDVSGRSARAPRKYAEEELDRYCESSMSSTTSNANSLLFTPFNLSSFPSAQKGSGLRRTPRRVPVRPSASGKGVTRGRLRGQNHAAIGSASPRAARGQLVISSSLSAR